LFLMNLVDAPARVQARLAGCCANREALSGEQQEVIALDFRPMASIGPDADAAIADGRLRRDLVERLGQVRIAVPPLRRRRQDLPLLAAHALRRACEEQNCGPKRFSRAALTLLSAPAVARQRPGAARGRGSDRRGHLRTNHPARRCAPSCLARERTCGIRGGGADAQGSEGRL
jgi:sigma54-dependent transcription regulator